MAKRKQINYIKNTKGCYICTSHRRNHKGYPCIEVKENGKRKNTNLSRYIYSVIYGKIPDGKIIRHKCDEPGCINPKHLEIGTHKDNMKDMLERKRECWGENKHGSKLKEKQVLEILKNTSSGIRELGRKYNVAHTTIIRIKQGKKWKRLRENIKEV